MRKDNALRVAPYRGGIQVASAWRMWAQGNEFYAAGRDIAHLGKISFHSKLNWQFRAGTVLQRLASPLTLSNGWILALEIVFLVDRGVLLPINQREDKVTALETPKDHKLLVDLLLSKDAPARVTGPPLEMDGRPLASHQLRNGALLRVVARVLPMTDDDHARIRETREQLRVNLTEMPAPADIYTEASYQIFKPTTGNIIVVVPVGYDSLAKEQGLAG